MDGTFTLTIRLGNEACQTAQDVAELLVKVAETMANEGQFHGTIPDVNGNRVGGFTVLSEEEAQ